MGRKNSRIGCVVVPLVFLVFAGFGVFLVFLDSPESQVVIDNQPEDDTFAQYFDRTWPPLEGGASVVTGEAMTRSSYYVILDGSGSMEESRCSGSQTKMAAAKDALEAFAAQFPGSANLGLAVFDGAGLSERVALAAVDRNTMTSRIRSVRASGGTPLLDALQLGYDALRQQARRQLGYGEYHLVVVTDGEANSGQDPTPIVNVILRDSPVVVHTIGFCIGESHSLNQPGRIDYRAADDIPALREGLQAVLAESEDFTVTSF